MKKINLKLSKKSLGVTVAVIIAILAIVFGFFYTQKKASGAALYTFGGKVTAVTYCTCYYDPAVVLTIDDYSNKHQTLKVKYSPFYSLLHAFYWVWTSGAYVIGGYVPVGVCLNTSGYYCTTNSGANPQGTIDLIRGIGTSIPTS